MDTDAATAGAEIGGAQFPSESIEAEDMVARTPDQEPLLDSDVV